MSAVEHLLETTHTLLKSSPVWSSLPLSVLSLGLEKLGKLNLSCPCNVWSNALIPLIFIGPALFLWGLMFVFLAPFRFCSKDVCACCECCTSENTQKKSRNDKQLCLKAFSHSLFPPIMWNIWLFLDGDYLACLHTNVIGDYVFDQNLSRKWCEPSELAYNKSVAHEKYRKIVGISQVIGYAILGVVGIIIFVLVCCNKKPRTKRTGVQTGQVETGSHSSAHPQGKAEDDIEEESNRLVEKEGISQL